MHPGEWQVAQIEENKSAQSFCRIDYLTAHYLNHDFERTKTLGDGDNVSNNKFNFIGSCEWSPEKGFEYRK